ncbi:AIM24 family protein [Frankia sp. AgKG'84/4]|uniref:AIM24 family protein n=1 Tax=Frankia sp. AgKG'84/4 TaxID=573490 RepID=UPI00200D485C|nr:AIM24 family protein [Frankia sp. AgKG'84/4]MCL9792856.1 AIM24 family protein [Frankia sp. AgKG'84/4]
MTRPLGDFAAGQPAGPPFALEEGERMLRVRLDGGTVYAKQGSMVAYRGRVDFAYKGQGVGGYLRRAVTGEGQDLMKAEGRGTVWFAESGSHISVFNLDRDALTVNGRSLLALESGVKYKVTSTSGGLGAMIAGGMFNTEVSGTGGVAVLCLGSPLVLSTDEPVCVDRDAAVAWTAGVRTRIVSTFKLGNLVGRRSGELAQIEYSGRGGFVVVQCGEIPAAGTAPDKA